MGYRDGQRGDLQKERVVSNHGHDWRNGVCFNCGKLYIYPTTTKCERIKTMSNHDLEMVRERLNRWEKILEKAVETKQHGMKATAEQKVAQYQRLLMEQS